MVHEPAVLIEGVLFRARYLGSTQLVSEGQPTKTTRMMQAEEAVTRIKVGTPRLNTLHIFRFVSAITKNKCVNLCLLSHYSLLCRAKNADSIAFYRNIIRDIIIIYTFLCLWKEIRMHTFHIKK